MSYPGESSPLFVEPSELQVRVKQRLPTFGLTLRGAVIRTWLHGSGRLGLLVRDTNYRSTAVVHVDVPIPERTPDRGTQIELVGELIEQQGDQLTIERLWRGESLRDAGVASGFLRRKEHARDARDRARLVLPTDRCDKLYVVTSGRSKAWPDITAALKRIAQRPDHVLAPRELERVECKLYQPERIAEAVSMLCERVKAADLVIVARGGGEWLDHFEDEAVITALVRLAEQCPTYTAIGHADDRLMLNGIVHRMFETPSSAIFCLDEMLREARPSASRESAGTRNRRGETPVERELSAPDARAAVRSPEPDPWRPVPAQPAPAWSPKPRSDPPHGDWRVALGALAVIAALSILVLLVFPARHSSTPAPAAAGSQAGSAETAPHRAQTDRSAAQKPSEKPGRNVRASAQPGDMNPERKPARAVTEPGAALQRPAIEPAAIGEAPPMPKRTVAIGDPPPANADQEPLRLVASLIAPFEVGRDLGAAREACAASHGMWSSESCRLPGGRGYRFGLRGGLVQTITLRQGEKTPVPLFSADALAALQQLAVNGRGPWRVAVTPKQLIVQPRPHHPGF
jgi:hypothetical protein